VTTHPLRQRPGGTHRALSRTLLIELIAPLAIFYGLRALGTDQLLALLAGAVLPATRAAYGIVTRRRAGGVQIFVLGAMTLTVFTSLITGSPRVLLIRNAWGMAAMGVWMLLTLLARRPFLYEATRIVLDEDRQRTWELNWERFPPLRHLLWVCSAVWGGACLVDAGLRVIMAVSLPVDLVPVLDDALLVVTIGVLLLFQRLYGRAYLRRHGLRLRGVHLSPVADPVPAGGPGPGRVP
jgi:hypothetical protein